MDQYQLQSYQHETTYLHIKQDDDDDDDDAVVIVVASTNVTTNHDNNNNTEQIRHNNNHNNSDTYQKNLLQQLRSMMFAVVTKKPAVVVVVILLLVLVLLLVTVSVVIPLSIRHDQEILLQSSSSLSSSSTENSIITTIPTSSSSLLLLHDSNDIPVLRRNDNNSHTITHTVTNFHDTTTTTTTRNKNDNDEYHRIRMIRQQLLHIHELIDGIIYFPPYSTGSSSSHSNNTMKDDNYRQQQKHQYDIVATGWIKQHPDDDDDDDDDLILNSLNSNSTTIGIVIIQVQNEQDVQKIIPIVSDLQQLYHFPFRIRSGGHHKLGYSSLSDVRNNNHQNAATTTTKENNAGSSRDGVVICLSKLNHLRMISSSSSSSSDDDDYANKNESAGESNMYTSIVIGPAVLVQDILQQVTSPYQYGGVIGFCSRVAEGGFVLGGGFGIQSRIHGLGLDNVVSFRVVVADGTIVTTTASNNHSDLHWALLGAGSGSYGVITEMEYKIYPVSLVLHTLQIRFHIDTSNLAHFLYQLGHIESNRRLPDNVVVMYDETNLVSLLWTGTNDTDVQNGNVILYDLVESIMRSVSTTYPLDIEQATVSWTDSYTSTNSTNTTDNSDFNTWADSVWAAACWTGFLLPENNTIDIWKDITYHMDIGLRHSQPYLLPDVELWGGAINRRTWNATAFPYRSAIYNVGVLLMIPVNVPNASAVFDRESKKVNDWWYKVDQYLTGSYVNYPTLSLLDHDDPNHYANVFWGDNLPRLVRIKQQYDPNNTFRFPMSVPIK